jgi:rhodanese-related sulfurtransferase
MQEFAEFTSANPWLVSGLFASGLAVLFYELRQKARNIGSVSTAMAVGLINKGCSVIDLRDADKFSSGHIVDSKNIPEADFSGSSAQQKKAGKATLLVCDSGDRSGELVGRLRKDGIENIYSISGGLDAWRRDNLPVVSDSATK